MKPNELNLESLIQEIFQEDAENVIVPPPQHIWEKISSDRQTAKTIRRSSLHQRFSTSKAIACFVISVLFIGLFISNQPAIAINSNILKTVVDFFSSPETTGSVNVSISKNTLPDSDAPLPPPDWPLDTGEKVVTLEQARSEAAFNFIMPSYLPKGVSLDIITVLNEFRVNQYYRSDKNRLVIEQHYFSGGFASSYYFSSSKVKKVNINGTEATLITQNNPYTGQNQIHILWCIDDIEFNLKTDLSEKDALKVARSIK
ncbi:conserved protein of unknown function [Tepidanaerobacter acetatoxydans Re1]|uniref:DUF4367 domain-containing protein n=1 Tax=Tepidanaerobacter acetatoxydans (strain DSM 21804 / JCM 16047 / Re1) TaxID=1209989 RepID=F4LW23_TEPAE|nr:DUF4367 domain-containing protein [Tepidanaerobacter acetatoxydans]AEE91691.1 hypothetical protein TepRe1_1546 [Tepidanaerobacter acetatoxydans Re1]CDI40774.1 conserved protein of unknown function [Tepidanaerobacter acetatoxydans Re1]